MPAQKYTELEHFLKSKTPALNVFDDDISATRIGDNKVTIYDVEKTTVREQILMAERRSLSSGVVLSNRTMRRSSRSVL